MRVAGAGAGATGATPRSSCEPQPVCRSAWIWEVMDARITAFYDAKALAMIPRRDSETIAPFDDGASGSHEAIEGQLRPLDPVE